MPKDLIWVDSCTVVAVGKGHFARKLELQGLRADRHELLIVALVRQELMQGNPLIASPKTPQWKQVPSLGEQRELARTAAACASRCIWRRTALE
jgi:hypothetical protein